MTETDNLVLEHLRAIRADIAGMCERLDRVELRLGVIEHRLSAIEARLADAEMATQKRLDRIERRLEPTE